MNFISEYIDATKNICTVCENFCKQNTCENCFVKANGINTSDVVTDEEKVECQGKLFDYLREKFKLLNFNDTDLSIIYHYDEDCDTIFDGYSTDTLETKIFIADMKEDYIMHHEKIKSIKEQVAILKSSPHIKYELTMEWENLWDKLNYNKESHKVNITPFNTKIETRYPGVEGCSMLYKNQISIHTIIDNLNYDTIERAKKYLEDTYEMICKTVDQNSPNFSKELSETIKELDDIMNNGAKRKIEEEKRKQKEDTDIAYMRKLIETYGIPKDLLEKEILKNGK